jgi:hypothetical protein
MHQFGAHHIPGARKVLLGVKAGDQVKLVRGVQYRPDAIFEEPPTIGRGRT